jgi:hypothetical protein
MSRLAFYASICGFLVLLVSTLSLLYVGSREPDLCEKGHSIRRGMTREEVWAVLGPSPYPRGNWPTIGRCHLGYPERCEHWDGKSCSVTVRFDPETELVDFKEIVFQPSPSPIRQLLERMKLVKPRCGYYYSGP